MCANENPSPFTIPAKNPRKVDPWVFWRETLGSPRHVMAPMVDGSDLAFRLLARRYGTHLTYTPMLHTSKPYRKQSMDFDPTDKPVIVQLGGTGVDDFLPAARRITEYDIASIDLNFGCPQRCARTGGYGCFLMLNNPEEALRSVKVLSEELSVPITCKMRIFPEKEQTIAFAKALEANGCVALAVHCRTKDQKGVRSGSPDWDIIKEIKKAVNIPIIANGGMQRFEDIEYCLQYTKADAVMSADAMLWNPAFFSNKVVDPVDLVLEYLELFERHPCKTRKILNGHVYEILRRRFDAFPEFRMRFIKCAYKATYPEIAAIFHELKAKSIENGIVGALPTSLPDGTFYGTPVNILRDNGIDVPDPLPVLVDPPPRQESAENLKIGSKREFQDNGVQDGPAVKKAKMTTT